MALPRRDELGDELAAQAAAAAGPPADQLDTATYDVVDDGTLLAAIAALPLPQRSVVVLRFYLDWDIARIAASLDVAPGTVKSRLHRALARLRLEQEVTP